MIAAQLEEAGGIPGPGGVLQSEVITRDTESTPDTAVCVVRRSIEEGELQVTVAGTLSDNSLSIAPVITEALVPYDSMALTRWVIQHPATSEVGFKSTQENGHSASELTLDEDVWRGYL